MPLSYKILQVLPDMVDYLDWKQTLDSEAAEGWEFVQAVFTPKGYLKIIFKEIPHDSRPHDSRFPQSPS